MARNDLKIVFSCRIPQTPYIAVYCDDGTLHRLEVPASLLRRNPNPDLRSLTVAEARQRIECRAALVDRGLDWVQAVLVRGADVNVALGDGEWVGSGRSPPAVPRQ